MAKTMNPMALSISEAAQLLSKLGGGLVTETTLRTDIDAGAPTNDDGSLNLVTYAAWLVWEAAHGD